MSGAYVEVLGLAETRARLEELAYVKIPKAIQAGERQGAMIFRAAIRAEAASSFASQPTGNLLHSITYKSVRSGLAVGRQNVSGTVAAGGQGYLIGPMGPGSQARALVIRGHDVKNRKSGPVLGRTRPNAFVARGQDAAEGAAMAAISAAFLSAIESAGMP